ncbi:MAG: YraN family protein [Ignavibacteriales bacterium]|nr:YraN family protein [Ignavibacteriales bacterium]
MLPAMKRSTRQRGNQGEDLAAEFLQRQGFTILQRNYRFERGEIDIVAQQGNEIVFVEVKARRSATFGAPEEAVDERKQAQLRRVADGYLFEHQLEDQLCRFDIVAVDYASGALEIRHLQHAF